MKNKLLLIGIAGGIGVIAGAAMSVMAFKKIMDEDMLCDDCCECGCDDDCECDCGYGCCAESEKDDGFLDNRCDGVDNLDGGSADNTADAGETGEDIKAGTGGEK